MTSLTPSQLAAINFDSHTSLTANAGSGKTFVLSKRYLEIARQKDPSLRKIAAITFTDKAAGELYKKIAKEVNDNLKEEIALPERKILEKIRRNLVSANISTIHSFCINILREFPVEAELDANFVPIDELTSNELIELSVDELIKKSLSSSDEHDLKYLIRILASKRKLSLELISMIKNRKNILRISEEIYSKTSKEIADFFHEEFLNGFSAIVSPQLMSFRGNLASINKAVLEDQSGNQSAREIRFLLEKIEKSDNLHDLFNILVKLKDASCTQKGKIKIRGYLPNKISEALAVECSEVEKFFNDIKKFELNESSHEIESRLAEFGLIIICFFNKALAIYSQKKKEHGYVDFEDVLLFTQKILRREDVLESIAERFDYIMVDEYQDTNEIQYRIFLPLLRDLKRGNLFVVGDEKQSIYMFRDAELEVFDITKKQIGDLAGKERLLNLPDSFRMAPNLCLFTNQIFKNLFKEPNILFNEVHHSDLICARTEVGEGSVELLIAKQNEDVNYAEAELVARRILQMVKDDSLIPKIDWGNIAILCRKRKSFSELEKIFSKYKIPFLIVGGKGFFQRQSVYDIFNYFSFLLDKENDTALVGILRSPFFTISDAEIFEISLYKGKNFYSKLQKHADNNDRFTKIINQLGENLDLAAVADATSILRKILNETEYLAVLAAKPNAAQELANIDKLINVANHYVHQDFKTLYDFVDFLKESIGELEDEAQAVVAEDSKAVQIMTLHQAKGLEFPAVFLYKCDDPSRKESVRSKQISVDKNYGILTKLPPNGDFFNKYESAPIAALADYINERKNLAEIKRLFYVGVTRAKDYLFISATENEKQIYSRDSFIGLFIEASRTTLPAEKIYIKGDLQFLVKKDEEYKNEKKILELEIPIIQTLPEDANKEEQVETLEKKKNITEKIVDFPEGEIISATKVAVYSQCPLKYQLTYEFGFNALLKGFYASAEQNIKMNSAEDFNEEDLQNSPGKGYNSVADVKGRIIHKLLQNEITDKTGQFIERELKNEITAIDYDEVKADALKLEILNDIEKFYQSAEYNFIQSFKDYKNEFELYVKQNDYYLYGIIDKIIFNQTEIKIIDYKTDNISVDEIMERSKGYLTQLKFYSYIVSRLFENILKFELRLVYLKHPDKPVIAEINREELKIFNTVLTKMVEDIRSKKFDKNLSHCSECGFAVNYNKCIVK